MRVFPVTVLLVALCSGILVEPLAGQVRQQQPMSVDPSRTVATYCTGCHNGVMRSPSGALLDQLDAARIAANADVWTRAYRQIQAGTMPPVGAPRPAPSASAALLTHIEAALGANVAPTRDGGSGEIAVRLAQMLWNGPPDASLAADAERNALSNSASLERHVRRMLQDDRASAFVKRFFFPFLALDRLASAQPNTSRFPEYDPSLRDAMARETELFLLSQLRADADPIQLWTANYSYLNEQLARHYGVPGVAGAQFRRVDLSTAERAGLLGHGSVLMATSRHANGNDPSYTSPASRALWIRLRFLGAPPPQPFPNAAPVKPELPITPQTRTLPAEPCANCHRNFFPLGYALENFDALGRWRTNDEAGPVDASGTYVDGTPTNGIIALREVLLQRPDAFRTTITEKLLDYVAGRPVTASPATPETFVRARQILNANPLRWSSIIAATVQSKSRP